MAGPAMKTRRLEFQGSRDAATLAAMLAAMEDALVAEGCPGARCAAFLIVAEEILTNVARHAWAAEAAPGVFAVAMAIRGHGSGIVVMLSTEDDGIPFDPTCCPAPALDAPVEQRAIGGLGIHLVRQMTERRAYIRRGGRNLFRVWWRGMASRV